MYGVVMTVMTVLCGFAFSFISFKTQMLHKLLFKLGICRMPDKTNWTAKSWEKHLRETKFEADVAFFGDSITAGGNFRECFSDKSVVNLGIPGATLQMLTSWTSVINIISPQKVFLMGGINGLTVFNRRICIQQYDELIDAVRKAAPDADVYVQSVLPISRKKERKLMCRNTTIVSFNRELRTLTVKKGVIYIDLFSVYSREGGMGIEYSSDGVHLKPAAYELWIQIIKKFVDD